MRRNLFLIPLFLFAFFYFSFGYQYFDLRKYHFDEAISMYGAARVLEGGVPYLDFWSFHMPGRFYILAGVFKVFGISLKAALLFAIFVLSLSCCGIYLFVSRVYRRASGMLAFFLALAWLKSYIVYNRPGQFAVLFFIICWLTLLNYLSDAKPKWLFISGFFTGVIGLFRMDFEFYCLAALFAVILLKDWRNRGKYYLFSGFLMVFLPTCAYLIRYGGFRELNDLILSGTWIKNRHLPLPLLKTDTLIFYLPVLIFSAAIVKILFFDSKTKKKDAAFYLNIFFLISGICLYSYVVCRADMSHLLPVMIPVIVLFVSLFDVFVKFLSRFGRFYRYSSWVICFSVSLFLLFSSLEPALRMSKRGTQMSNTGELDVARAKGFYDFSAYGQSVISAVKYIQSKTGSHEKIFVGNLRHDRLVNSDVMFYFLSERGSATKYYHFEPGFTNTKSIQQAIIRDLKDNRARYVILWTASEKINEPNNSSRESGINDLDDFIRQNYELEKQFDYYLVLRNK